MLLTLCKSKITPATVTQTELWYEGSITVDADLIEAAGLVPYEQVHVLNINNGERIITYVIEGTRGSGIICLNGPSARAAVVGDLVTLLAYAQMTPEEARTHRMTLIKLDAQNRRRP